MQKNHNCCNPEDPQEDAIPSHMSDETPIADDQVLNMITRISNSDSEAGNVHHSELNNIEASQINSSCNKSSVITETSPEPEVYSKSEHYGSFQEEDEEEVYPARQYWKLKKLQSLYISLAIALGVAFVGTLFGLIAVVTTRRTGHGIDTGIVIDTAQSNTHATVYPLHAMEFPHIDGTDPDIARAFADYTLYDTFYGVTYYGVANSSDNRPDSYLELTKRATKIEKKEEEPSIQREIALDVALLSRVTSRLRFVHNNYYIIDRVIQALGDLRINMKLTLNVNANEWNATKGDIFRVLNSYNGGFIESVYIETTSISTPEQQYTALAELDKFINSTNNHGIKTGVIDGQKRQANPLKLSSDPSTAIEWINSDHSRHVYLNLETPSETSEKAAYMTSWVCRVVPKLAPGIEWFWPNAFDDQTRGVDNGIFTSSRKMKPAGLPRCT